MIKLKNIFTEHPHSINETYFQHMRFALKTGFRVSKVLFAIVVHAILPFCFKCYARENICKLSGELEGRVECCKKN